MQSQKTAAAKLQDFQPNLHRLGLASQPTKNLLNRFEE